MRKGFVPGSWSSFPYMIVNIAFFILVIAVITIQAMRPGPWLMSQGVGVVGCYYGMRAGAKFPGGALTTLGGCAVGYGAGQAGFMHFVGPDGNAVTVSIEGAEDIRATGIYPIQVLSFQTASGQTVIGQKLKQRFTCQEHSDPVLPCAGSGDTPGEFKDAVRNKIVPDSRKWYAEASYRGTVIHDETDQGYSRGPSVYHTRIAMPGGQHAELIFKFEGMRGGVIWE